MYMKYYTVYQITNLINGKLYIGAHKTEDVEDNYMGSGKYLNYAINKYGIEHFRKEILEIFDNSTDMFNLERELVNEDFVLRKDTYNLKLGGEGGFDYINSDKFDNPCHSAAYLRSISQFGKEFSAKHRDSILRGGRIGRKIIQENWKCGLIDKRTFSGKQHTRETKHKMSKAKQGKCSGEQNSQYGTCWVYNIQLKENKKIKKEDLQRHLGEGWIAGRKMEF